MITDGINSKKLGPQKITTVTVLHLSLFLFLFFFFLLLRNETCKIMVGCWSCTCPSIHRFIERTLKVTVGCQGHGRLSVEHISKLCHKKTCTHVLASLDRTAKKKWELWARPPVLTPVPSQAIHSSLPSPSVQDGSDSRETCTHVSTQWAVSRDTSEQVAHMWDSLVSVSEQQQ